MRKYRPLAVNRRAKFDYKINDRLLAGISLLGTEVKSIRLGMADLKGTFAAINEGELWLNNAYIPPYQPGKVPKDYDTKRARKLLVHKKELKRLAAARQNGMHIVPLSLGVQGRFLKLEIGIGKSKKKQDKRETIKKRTAEREANRSIKRASK